MSEHSHDHNPQEQQAQDALPGGRLHVNGAEGGPVSDGGKGAGGKGGNGKAPPGNGAEGGRSLDTRMAVLETEHKHLATKADLHATELRMVEKAQENKEELRKEIQAVRKEAQENKDDLQTELRKMPFRLAAWLGALATVAGGLAGFIYWLLERLG